MSWGSFVVVPEIVPGRMVLLVTTLLSLVTMFDTVRNNSPDALELKCIEVWLISCTLFVFLALMEYFIVLFGIRYDKHWRTDKPPKPSSAPLPPPQLPQQQSPQSHSLPPPLVTTNSIIETQRNKNNGLENAARMFATANKVTPENRSKKNTLTNEFSSTTGLPKRKFRNAAEYALLYAGSHRGKLDQISLVVFPLSFLVFTIVYWSLYLSESRKRM